MLLTSEDILLTQVIHNIKNLFHICARLPGFDDKVISLYARGLPVREIQGHLTELYGLEVSPDLISTITAEVMEEVNEWQNQPAGVNVSAGLFRCLAGQNP